MASEHPEAAYAARLLERQDTLQAEANRLVEQLELSTMLGRAGRFERLGSTVSGLMVWRDLDLGARCGAPAHPYLFGDQRHPHGTQIAHEPQ